MFLKWVQGYDTLFFFFFQRELMYILHRRISDVPATVLYIFLK